MKFFDRKICLTQLSKDAKGKLNVKQKDSQVCERLECKTLKAQYELNLEIVSHKDCDKLPGFDGRLVAELRVATDNDGNGRGFHKARYRWETIAGDVIVGRMRGIINAGSHRKCENCDTKGHMEGVMGGRIIEGKNQGCRVRASYVIDLDPSSDAQDSVAEAAIEGVMVCRCDQG